MPALSPLVRGEPRCDQVDVVETTTLPKYESWSWTLGDRDRPLRVTLALVDLHKAETFARSNRTSAPMVRQWAELTLGECPGRF